jgi:glycosyltransferase involved in cell wall biosynthesis
VVDKIQFKFITNNKYIIPCGVNLELFKPLDPTSLKIKYKFSSKKRYILFSSRFNNKVKNWPLATQAIDSLNSNNIEVIELDGYSRLEVAELMNICDMALLTSVSEGSPQFIKEAMACNIPVVSTDVGDVKEVIGNTEGCYICSYDQKDVAEKIKMALEFGKRTKGRQRILELGLDSKTVADKIINVYKQVLNIK